MFNLRRYFSLTCAAALVVVAVVLLLLYRQNALGALVESAEGQNVTLARSFANILWPRFAGYVTSVSTADGDALRARPETREIHDALISLTLGLPVLKVKIYNLDGLTVYSSQPSQMGVNKSNNQGFILSARQGKPASKLSYRDSFSAFSGEIRNRDLVESYLPIWGGDGAIEGVFELYTDVTPAMARIERRATSLMIGVLAIFGLFYAVLFLIVHRADRIMHSQYASLMKNKDAIKEQNTELEHEVAKRTLAQAELREAHGSLEIRVRERTVELTVAKNQAETASRAKSEFLAMMSHELRTPLNAVIGFSGIMKNETLGPVGSPQYRDYAVDINESGKHLLDLIEDILDLSKVESGEDELNIEEISVSGMVHAVLPLVKGDAEIDGIGLKVNLEDGLPLLRADERKLKQILVNLLSNAIKFTKTGGKVELKAWRRKNSGHVFQITDTGIGIAPEDIPKALAPFQQVDGALSRKYQGTGLGLPLAKAQIEMHGGSLELESKVGVGTTVTVRFPASRVVIPSPEKEHLFA